MLKTNYLVDINDKNNQLSEFKHYRQSLLLLFQHIKLRSNKRNLFLEIDGVFYELYILLKDDDLFELKLKTITEEIYSFVLEHKQQQMSMFMSNFSTYQSFTAYQYLNNDIEKYYHQGFDDEALQELGLKHIKANIASNNTLQIDSAFIYKHYKVDIITYFSATLEVYFIIRAKKAFENIDNLLHQLISKENFFPVNNQLDLIFVVLNSKNYSIIDISNHAKEVIGIDEIDPNKPFTEYLDKSIPITDELRFNNLFSVTNGSEITYIDSMIEEITYYGQKLTILIGVDVSHIIKINNDVTFEKDVYYSIINESRQGAIIFGPLGNMNVINQSARHALGLNSNHVGRSFDSVLEVRYNSSKEVINFEDLLHLLKNDYQDNDYIDIRVLGKWKQFGININPIYRDNIISGYILMFDNVSQHLKQLNQFKTYGYRDSMTRLYNRRYVKDQLANYDESTFPVGVVVIDGDNLKLINDSFGYSEGDHFIKVIAKALRKVFKKDSLIARWGGDEYLVIVENASLEMLEDLCQRFELEVAELNNTPHAYSASYGYTLQTCPSEKLNTLISRAEVAMNEKKYNNRLTNRYHSLIMEDIISKNDALRDHSTIVMILAYMIGTNLNLNHDQIDDLLQFAYVHDIGKTRVDQAVLFKEGKLNEDDWMAIKEHPSHGYNILKEHNISERVANLVLSHHERIDGSGYPCALSGNDILIEVRIVAVCDAFDAMVRKRHYSQTKTIDEAKKELVANINTQFDIRVVEAFMKIPNYILESVIKGAN